jgi:hypothetical protein
MAKRLDDDSEQTKSGAILGTPSYMAPEQAHGNNSQIGPATDVYALGAILYETLTGRPPFRAATVLETMEQVRSDEPVSPCRLQPSAPRELEIICLKCLQKEPERRYHTAQELADDLQRFLAGEPIHARPIRWWQRTFKWAKRKPAAAALPGIATLLGIALIGVLAISQLYLKRGQREQERIAQVRFDAERGNEDGKKFLDAGQGDNAKRQFEFSMTALANEPSLDAYACEMKPWWAASSGLKPASLKGVNSAPR